MYKKTTFITFLYSILIYLGICLFPFNQSIPNEDISQLVKILLLLICFIFLLFDNRHNDAFKGRRLCPLYFPLIIGAFSNFLTLIFTRFTICDINVFALIEDIILFSLIACNEEIIFRFLFLDAFINKFENRKYSKMLGILLSSVLFSLCHLINAFSFDIVIVLLQVAYSLCLGIVLAIVRIESKLTYSLFGHILFNVFNGIIFENVFSFIDTSNSYIIVNVVIGSICVIYALATYITLTKRREKNAT